MLAREIGGALVDLRFQCLDALPVFGAALIAWAAMRAGFFHVSCDCLYLRTQPQYVDADGLRLAESGSGESAHQRVAGQVHAVLGA